MADQLAAPLDLAYLLERDDLGTVKTTMLVECATAVVQEAAGRPPQRIVEVLGDTAYLIGTTDSVLELPQRPVTAVTSVLLDGQPVTEGTGTGQWRRPGNGSRLWRDCGWASVCGEPSTVTVVNDHGYPSGHQGLQLGRNAVLGLIRGVYDNPEGKTRVQIDDYAAAFERLAAALEASPNIRAALRRQYGSGGRMVRL